MLPEDNDTIAAISTGPGVGAIGLVRLSGPDSIVIADRVFVGHKRPSEMEHSTVQFGRIVQDGAVLDEVMLTVLRSPRSYTGEDMVEISCHGNPLVLKDVLSAVIETGARLATGGEFTRRAFLRGKMDLCQAEAVMELLSAQTEEAKRVALSQVRGRTSQEVARLREQVIRAKAELDASIDFPEDVADEAVMRGDAAREGSGVKLLSDTARQLEAMIAAFAASQQVQQLPTAAIVGKVNVGKSTLLNALLAEDRVITSEAPGTTRDRIDADLALLSGRRVRLSDTAGLVVPRDELDVKARAKMEGAARDADVLVMVFDVSSPLEDEDVQLVETWGARPAVLVLNKTDLGERWDPSVLVARCEDLARAPVVRTCAISGFGLDELETSLDKLLCALLPKVRSEACVVGTVRNERLLRRARDAINTAIKASQAGPWPEFASSDLGAALGAFNEFLGIDVGVDILDEIFSRFCIGK